MKYVYPAIFTPEEGGLYSVSFPDLPGCYTQGDDIPDAIDAAEDALCLMLYDMEERKENIPAPSDIRTITPGVSGAFVSLITADTLEYRKYYDSKAVNKTLTLPAWLEKMATNEGVNFSFILQKALKKELHITD